MKKDSRRIQKELTKVILTNNAYDLFAKQGILTTRMSDIAEAAGVSHGTVFLHFRTQDDLIVEVISIYCGKIAERTHELADCCVCLRDILSAHLDGIMEFEPFYTRLVIENRLLPPPARDAWVSMQSAISFHFSRVVERDAVIVPSDMLFNTWIGLVHHYLANGDLFAPEGNVIQRYKDTLIDNYLKMVQNITKQ